LEQKLQLNAASYFKEYDLNLAFLNGEISDKRKVVFVEV